MKIYILPVQNKFQPPTIPIIYPPHNSNFKDGEETFFSYIQNNKDLITTNPKEADWHYLPIFWTHWLVSHKFGTIGNMELQQEINRCTIDDTKTFTIYEYAEQPKINIGKSIAFLGSRTNKNGLDMPLLCKKHITDKNIVEKKYLASFVGSLSTHPIRNKLKELLKNRIDVFYSSSVNTDFFVKTMLESYIAICPRGYGGASYRFYEAMQLGIVPLLIGDIDHRPFKEYIPWNECSIYIDDVLDIHKYLDKYDKKELEIMGRKAQQIYEKELSNDNWCKYVLYTLEKRNNI